MSAPDKLSSRNLGEQHDEQCFIELDGVEWRIKGQTRAALIVQASNGRRALVIRHPHDIGQHDDHTLLTLGGRMWKIGGKEGDLLWVTDRYGNATSVDTSSRDWKHYCATATAWLANAHRASTMEAR